MQQHVRIAVPDRVSIVRHLDATNTKRSAFRESVSVVAYANPLVRRLSSLSLSARLSRVTSQAEMPDVPLESLTY
jgi:hypothetical protein